jgi:hypothetical protein
VHKAFRSESEGKKPLGRSGRRWVDNIKMDLKELGCWGCGQDSSGLGVGAVVENL